jgi:hypothetical protein
MKIKIGGITKRWVFNTLCVIVFLLVIVSVIIASMIRNNYYQSVTNTLRSASSDVVLSILNLYGESQEEIFYSGAIEFVENFAKKDVMEVWVIDKDGKILVSSSGFDITSDLSVPEYSTAINSNIGQADWKGELPSNEKVMALTTILSLTNGANAGAVRYMISLEEVDRQLNTIYLLVILACLFAISLVIISGMFL